MASKNKNKWYRINEALWRLDEHHDGDVTMTHTPQQLTPAVAKRVIESAGYRNGKHVVVEVEAPDTLPEEPEPEPEIAPDDEVDAPTG